MKEMACASRRPFDLFVKFQTAYVLGKNAWRRNGKKYRFPTSSTYFHCKQELTEFANLLVDSPSKKYANAKVLTESASRVVNEHSNIRLVVGINQNMITNTGSYQ